MPDVSASDGEEASAVDGATLLLLARPGETEWNGTDRCPERPKLTRSDPAPPRRARPSPLEALGRRLNKARAVKHAVGIAGGTS
jgi:hypothetical protein